MAFKSLDQSTIYLNDNSSKYKKDIKLNNEDVINCTAGIQYCYVNFMGQIYRCCAHASNLYKMLGTIFDLENLSLNINSICDNFICRPVCDGIHTKQWKNEKEIFIAHKEPNIKNDNSTVNNINNDGFLIIAELMYGCINKCVYCENTIKNHKIKFADSISWINFLEKISNLKKGKKYINFAGLGEPTLHPDFSLILEKCFKLNYQIKIITSALNYNDIIIDNIRKCSKKINNISISLHPTSPLWDIKKIKYLIKIFEEENIDFCLTLVKHQENIDKIPMLSEIASEFDKKILIYELMNHV